MNNPIAKTPLRQVQDVKSLLWNDHARQQLAAVAAKHMNPERLMRVTANAIRTTPKLQNAEPLSFLGALMQCAALGLEPNTVLGHAYLIPFDKKQKNPNTGRWEVVRTDVQLVIGYKGLIDLARRSGHITSISANIHYSDDALWEYEEGTEARLRHQPGPRDGQKLHAYAIAKFRDGGHAYVVLPWAHVMRIRDESENWKTAVRYGKQGDTPWAKHEDAMAMKTAIRALAKYLPLSVEMADAMQVDHDGGHNIDYASFAMNPDDGPMIDGEVVADNEANTPEETGLDHTEKDGTPEPAKKAEATAKPDPEKAKPTTDDPAAKKARNKHMMAKSHIEGDLGDGAPLEGTKQFHAEALEAMKAEAPDIYAEVEAIFAAYEAKESA